jgi:DNA-binding MarR family transcriptional regulator/GNAT superfamily N-acetyltransferase
MRPDQLAADVSAFRAFNRFITRKIGVLREGLLDSSFSLSEARILFELAQGEAGSAAAIAEELGLDPGYLSRVLSRFEARGLVTRRAAEGDSRRRLLALNEAGRAAFALLDGRSRDEATGMLEALSDGDRSRLIRAMRTIEGILGERPAPPSAFVLREPEPGDLGWVVQRHGAVYAREYGWGAGFEALVARIVADYAAGHDPQKERCWIADLDGVPVGSVFLVRVDEATAKLRLLLVEPEARGRKLGVRLVDECIRFARSRGYRKLTLWTNSVLTAARGIYAAAGFALVASEPERLFGEDLVSETWDLDLTQATRGS